MSQLNCYIHQNKIPQNYSELKKTWCKPLNGKGIVSRLHKELLKLNS